MPNLNALEGRNAELLISFGQAERAWLDAALNAFWDAEMDSYECVDNSRICLAGDAEGEALYEEVAGEGCCGSYDGTVGPSPLGHTYRFGFNYGH